MITKHFIKVLILFIGSIVLGLVGVFLVSYFNKDGGQTTVVNTNALNSQNTQTSADSKN